MNDPQTEAQPDAGDRLVPATPALDANASDDSGAVSATSQSEAFSDEVTDALAPAGTELGVAPSVPGAEADLFQEMLRPLVDLAGHGGPVLLVLLLMSIAALTIVLAKLWQFSWMRLNAREPVETALSYWYRDDPDAALAAVGASREPSARLVARAIDALQGAPANTADGLDLLREELTRLASDQLERLRGWLRALEVIAALSPLLGLLGTVLGMIEAFRQLALANNQVDPAMLSGGIWEALLTTAAGLSVAIPAVLLHSWLERRVDRCAQRMEDAVTRVFTRSLGSSTRDGLR